MEQVDTAHSPEPAESPGGFFSPALAGRIHASDINLDGSNVAYWAYEPVKQTPDTRTILVIHGFRGDHHGLLRVVDHLPEMRIIMPDLPGFGRSEPFVGDKHSVERYGSFISSFMEALGLGTDTVLLGHSFGSIIASHFAAAHPGAIYPLVLVNPIAGPALEGPKGLMTKLAVLYYQLSARLPQRIGLAVLRNRLIVRIMSVSMAKTRDKHLRRFIHGQHDAYFSAFADRESLLESFRASVSANAADVAPKLTLPVLLIAGERDEIATLPDQRKLLEQLPDGTLQVIPGVGHLIHYETPAPAANYIRSFLKDHPA
jgi:pimeloyl-ACP methyl ester carboxylesterase